MSKPTGKSKAGENARREDRALRTGGRESPHRHRVPAPAATDDAAAPLPPFVDLADRRADDATEGEVDDWAGVDERDEPSEPVEGKRPKGIP